MEKLVRQNLFNNTVFWIISGIISVSIILSPIVYLYIRDGIGNGIFPIHDQLDETILNYYFTAKYFGADTYAQMMCGIPAEGLKPFCPIFVPLYAVFNVYIAFLLQHCIVVFSAFFGMFFFVKEYTGRNEAAFVTAVLFALLPVHSIYGNVVAGTPLLMYGIMKLRAGNRKLSFVPALLIIYYALSTSFVLCGWAALGLVALFGIVCSIKQRGLNRAYFLSAGILLATYLLCNIDLIMEVFSANSFISHRVEFGFGETGASFWGNLWARLSNGAYTSEAESKHELIIIPVIVSLLCFFNRSAREKYLKKFVDVSVAIAVLCVVCAFFDTDFVYRLQHGLPGMLKSFQFGRFHYFIPAMWFVLLGLSLAIIMDIFPTKILWQIAGYTILAVLVLPTFLKLAKDKDGIFYQNINQINNGESVTGYVTMSNLYSEDLMEIIEKEIGKDMSSYRVLNIGISPVAALMHGFYTVDGYSNNYPLEYKHRFREVISAELDRNDYARTYFDKWGSRCYAFYHEWGNAYMLGKTYNVTVSDLNLNIDKLQEMNCRYIFAAGAIDDCESRGLEYLGDYETEKSYWHIWVYEVREDEKDNN